ncbi:unnamed protein product [Adineta ricciae]|uniref:G-protein coupled receptors family 2 profile 2 domain-containing protein n=1 Tax=Adineta ricciae TaxID=249248 RepID=A0A815ED14_ADIRI|nr:unnamed protein product [Adineta ricciae]
MFSYIFLVYLFQISLSIQIDEQCSFRDTCFNQSTASPLVYDHEEFIQERNCFCDPVCQQYGDCCGIKQNIAENKYKCIDFLLPTITNKSIPFHRLNIWMRTECLPIYTGSPVDKQCRNLNDQLFIDNPSLFIPVTSLQTNITYRNYYCAFCNNDVNGEIQFWEYKPFCHGDGSEKDNVILDNDEKLQYYVHTLTRNCLKTIVYPHERGTSRPSVFIRPCKKPLPATCPLDTPVNVAQKCSTFGTAYRYRKNSTVIYKNPYCAQCNHLNDSDEITCLDPTLRSALPPLTLIRIHPLSILFDPNLLNRYINNNTIPRIIYSINYNCTNANELYDIFEKRCLPVSNSYDEFIISMKCTYPRQISLQNDDKLSYQNGSLFLINHGILLLNNEYVFISDNRIVFCADRWTDMHSSLTNAYSFPIYRNVLSIICTSISLLCLLIFGIIFWLVPSLHNLPGKCLLFLSISLFIGQITFISMSNLTGNYSLCFASAIFIHYFYLSSFFWLLIISLNICSTFHHQQTVQTTKSTKINLHLIAYNVIVWCLTGIIILTACLIQFTHPQSSFSPAYASIFCSISRANAMIVFFLLPIGCILVAVAVLFIKTLLAIYRSHRIAKFANNPATPSSTRDTNMTFVYVRLASLMGIQWILLVIALAIGQTWSWVIFEIVNSLPGVFICFGFLFSKRVWKILKDKLSMKLIARRQSSRSNTTTSTMIASPSLPPINPSKKFHF